MSSEYDVMIIDSDPDCRRTLEYILSTSCFETSSVPDGRKALEKMKSSPPDIIILSLTLPDIDGIRLLRMIRNRTETPVLVISSQNIEEEIVTAFETGADDFITKPFRSAELIARIQNAIRHAPILSKRNNSIFSTGDMTLNYRKEQVYIRGQKIHLTKNEFKILSFLSQNAGKIVSYEKIINHVWGINPGGDTRILRVNITNIRKKIENDSTSPEYIITEPGIGYRIPCMKY